MITDNLGRNFKKLRISLTHECNYACIYCSDRTLSDNSPSAFKHVTANSPIGKLLGSDDLMQIVKNLHAQLHFETVRLTGGEPLLHPRVESIIAEIKKTGIENIGMTTNGHLLAAKAESLHRAGLKSVNISIDGVSDASFKEMSRYNGLSNVLKAIEAAIHTGLHVKLNTVVMAGKNDNQILPLLRYALHNNIVIRFLELMAMGPLHHSHNQYFYPQQKILDTIRSAFLVEALPYEPNATAHYWAINGQKAFGIIANDSTPFCADCNRLRIDSYGNIYGCLSNLKGITLNTSTNSIALTEALKTALGHKQQLHFVGNERTMQSIGG